MIDRTSGGLYVSGNHNFIGGFSAEERNLISGTTFGLSLLDKGTESNFVMGNYVGTDVTGRAALPNSSDGITVDREAQQNFIQANVVSGNEGSGVHIRAFDGNRLRGNRIGVAASSSSSLGNRTDGVRVEGTSNSIGGALPGDGNVVANNAGSGVRVISQPANLIQGNSIYANGSGIELEAGGDRPAKSHVLFSLSRSRVTVQACFGC